MSETAFDFMKIWTQSEEKPEIRIETVRDSPESQRKHRIYSLPE